jgi:hypothetical protein
MEFMGFRILSNISFDVTVNQHTMKVRFANQFNEEFNEFMSLNFL